MADWNDMIAMLEGSSRSEKFVFLSLHLGGGVVLCAVVFVVFNRILYNYGRENVCSVFCLKNLL